MNNRIIKNNKGFSVLEMVIVVFIITMGLLGLSAVLIQNIGAQNVDKNSLIASGLAQEGLELVRTKRDGNWKNSLDWNNGLVAGEYLIDYNGGLRSGSDYRLYLNSAGFYDHNLSTISSIFSRKIIIIDNPDGSIGVQSEVVWLEKEKQKKYIVEENLYDWQ
jgi:type II secretory pathway pseudopilin PulG